MQQSFSGVEVYTFLTLHSLQAEFHTLILMFPSLQNHLFFCPSQLWYHSCVSVPMVVCCHCSFLIHCKQSHWAQPRTTTGIGKTCSGKHAVFRRGSKNYLRFLPSILFLGSLNEQISFPTSKTKSEHPSASTPSETYEWMQKNWSR